MNHKNLLLLILIFSSFKAISNTERDSVGVENSNGKKVILHKIEPKETYYAIGRRYNISPQSIMEFNKNIPLRPSEIIKIPTQQNFNNKPVSFSSPSHVVKGEKQIIHTVMPGETLYGIASKYNMRVDDLKLLNDLTSSTLKIGQTIKVITAEAVSLKPTQNNTTADKPSTIAQQKNIDKTIPNSINKIKYVDSTDSQNTLEIPRNRYGITEVNDKGVAVCIEDKNLDATKSYALHRTAPVGTIVKISNPMTNRSTFAKVVGRFSENENTKDVIIVITKASAEAIGALDKRFLVNITFGIPNEQ
jgi:LysM repeat protein